MTAHTTPARGAEGDGIAEGLVAGVAGDGKAMVARVEWRRRTSDEGEGVCGQSGVEDDREEDEERGNEGTNVGEDEFMMDLGKRKKEGRDGRFGYKK